MVLHRIGRDEGNDIVIDDSSVSRRHAQIEDMGRGRYRITDLGSANGSFVAQGGDWHQFSEAEITANERLMLGEFATTASELMRRVARSRPTGVTVMAEADETRRGDVRVAARPPAERETLGGIWSAMPEYQKIAAIVIAGVLGLLIVAAAVFGILESL